MSITASFFLQASVLEAHPTDNKHQCIIKSITKPILQQTAHKTLPQTTTAPLSRKSPGRIKNWRHWSVTGGALVHCSCYWTPGGRTQEWLRIYDENIPPRLRNHHSSLSQLAHGLESDVTNNLGFIYIHVCQ